MSYLTPQAEQLRDSFKKSVRVASTGNINLAATLTVIDTVALNDQDRVLIKSQTTPAENGIYVWSSSSSLLSRSRDGLQFSDGLLVTVQEGAVNADTLWKLTTNNPITVGVTGLTFEEQREGGTLAETLALGSFTGGTNIIISSGDLITTPEGISLTIKASDNSVATGSSLSLVAGDATGSGDPGGDIFIQAGEGGPTNANGGGVFITAGPGNIEVGGELLLLGGTGGDGFDGGPATLQGGPGGSSDGPGASAVVRGGFGGTANGPGGNVLLIPGPGSGAGADGIVQAQGTLSVTQSLRLTNNLLPPVTGASEGGLFVNLANNLVYRESSSGASIPLTGITKVLTAATNEYVDGVTSQIAAGQIRFLPTEWGGSSLLSYYFEVVLSVNDPLRTAQAWLYNVTDGEIVTGTTLSTSSTTPVALRSAALTVGVAAGNLKTTAKVYEVRLSNDGTVITELSFLGSAMMIVER